MTCPTCGRPLPTAKRLREQARRQQIRARGLCVNCGLPNADPTRANCRACRLEATRRATQAYQRKKQQWKVIAEGAHE